MAKPVPGGCGVEDSATATPCIEGEDFATLIGGRFLGGVAASFRRVALVSMSGYHLTYSTIVFLPNDTEHRWSATSGTRGPNLSFRPNPFSRLIPRNRTASGSFRFRL